MTVNYNSPYIPSFLKSALQDSKPIFLTFSDIIDTNVSSTSSFKYEPINFPLKNTQQLNIDWENFENHTFFSSAEVKVNVAFDQIINGFPFDGTKSEVERFFEKISGFENWIFNQFPKFSGYLHFSGTQVNENPLNGSDPLLGTWIKTADSSGWLYPDLSTKKTAKSHLNIDSNKSFTIEAQVFIPDQPNDRQVVLQKTSSDKSQSYTFHLEPSISNTVDAFFIINSGSTNNFVSASLKKGKFNHVCMTLNKETGKNLMQFFVDEELITTSDKDKFFGLMDDKSELYIGSGSSFYKEATLLYPQQTFSGSIDELRIFQSTRTIAQQKIYSTKGLYASNDLKLYYRFNEPNSLFSSTPSDEINSIVLDSSGNALHANISNYDLNLRKSTEEDPLNPVKNERKEFKIILFPGNQDIINLNERLLQSASLYDQENPNLITKLIPRHYLRAGALSEGYPERKITGFAGDPYQGEGLPGTSKLGSTQIMLTFLYIWSKFFDEIKLFVDSFKTLRTIDYDKIDTVPDNFLNDFIRSYGIYLPPFFNGSNIKQYVEAEDITEAGVSNYSLKEVQTQILRRILVNIPDILRSKGTQHSIRAFLRSVGIDPDNSVRIREFGGPSIKNISANRETRTDVIATANCVTSSLVFSNYLSASRIEPGYPEISGIFVDGASNNSNDGLLTSGSWTFEGLYKFGPNNLKKIDKDQSLFRLETTGSAATAKNGVIVNVVAPVNSGTIYAYIRPGMSTNSPMLTLSVPANIFNGDAWNISVGCDRNDSIDSIVSSSYFLRAANQNAGEINDIYTTSSYFYEKYSTENNALQSLNNSYNASGSFIMIGGNQSPPASSMGYVFLNDTLTAPIVARSYQYVGQVSNLKFWSKGIKENEWREHVRNHKSVGVENALLNYNYVTNLSGSFEKLRIHTILRQENLYADSSGEIVFLDYSQNDFHLTGSGFDSEQRVLIGDIIPYSYLSPYFDEYSTSEKVRIRSFTNEENLIDAPWATITPLYELAPEDVSNDDPRLSIEFSLIDALNKDIITMFSDLDQIGNIIGSPELMFSPDYPGLEKLRDVYFNRISDKLNFRGFFEFYKWFDLSISTFIEQLIPRKTHFRGTNFVVESHMLERNKKEYHHVDGYLGDSIRGYIADKDLIQLQLISGEINKY
jgi:hypothetical protein